MDRNDYAYVCVCMLQVLMVGWMIVGEKIVMHFN